MRHTQTPGSTYTASSGLQRGLLRRENPDNHVTILKLSNAHHEIFTSVCRGRFLHDTVIFFLTDSRYRDIIAA